jgi:hypothetical protein
MELSLPISERQHIITRSFQTAASALPSTIEEAVTEVEAQYLLQLASYVPFEAKKAAVASIIDSSLPSDVQDQISAPSVLAVFSDLVRTGLVPLEITWVEEQPAPEPAPAPEPEPEPEPEP